MAAPSASVAGSDQIRTPVESRDWPGLASGLIIAMGALAAYSRTFSVPLLSDDRASIANNASIRHLWPLWPVLSPPADAGVRGRPLYNLSFALNYAGGGTAVFGYHVVNLAIHVLAGWVLFALARRTLRCPTLAPRFGSAATPLALLIAAIWTWHPLQTESVTYLSQRAESMMGLCFLLAMYGFVRGVDAIIPRRRRIWFACAVLACAAGAGTKEVIVTAPLITWLYDRTFISGSFAAAWRRHWPVFVGLAASWLPLGYLMLGLGHLRVGFGSGVAWWAYGLVECRAILLYLKLIIWPHPLIFDYGIFTAPRLPAAWAAVAGLAALLAATGIALRRWPAAGFAAAWFFVILAPVSSIAPVATQPIAESRTYLPLAGIVALVVLGGFLLAGRRALTIFAVAAVGAVVATAARNDDYRSAAALWSDTIAQLPNNPRAHNNLGYEWQSEPGRTADAIAEYETALRLAPGYADAHNNLGAVWEGIPGRLEEAIFQYRAAIHFAPDRPEFHYNLGNALQGEGRTSAAISEYAATLRLDPDFAEAQSNWASALAPMPGRLDDAIAHYETAARLRPDNAALQFNLAAALLRAPGRRDEAKASLEAGLRIQPGNQLARQILERLQTSP
jgi:tetratricopeptide (TPR) repeat protein